MKADTFGYHPVVIPDDAAGRPLSPSELATIADLEQRLLLGTPEPVRARARRSPRRRWYRSANAAPLTALVVVGMRTDERVLVLGCGTRSLRFRPALTVTEQELAAGVAALDRVLAGLGR